MVKDQQAPKRIFFIEKTTFLRNAIEFSLKAKGVEVYTVESIADHFYLLDDLRPSLILFDVKTVGDQLITLKPYGEFSTLVGIGDKQDHELVKEFVKAFLTKPLIANNLAEKILSLLD